MTDQVIVTALTCKTFQPTLLPYLLTCDDSLRKTLWRAADPLPLPPMIFDDMGQFAGKTDATTSLFFNPLQICGPFKRPLDTPVGLLLGKEPVCKSQILSPATVQCH